MAVDVIVGLQRGDEGKGRFVDLRAKNYQIIARGNGGANAGHTVVPSGMAPLALHQIPSGIAYTDKLNIIGNGVFLDPVKLQKEIHTAQAVGLELTPQKLLISDTAHLVLPHHIALDVLREGGKKAQGSTKVGIAYASSAKFLRENIRVESIFDNHKVLAEIISEGLHRVNEVCTTTEQISKFEISQLTKDWLDATEAMKGYVANTVEVMKSRLEAGDNILAEGAQAFWLDINHGMYPSVTSSSTTVSGLLDGLGVSPKQVGKVSGVAKLVKSHVGSGPFVTEMCDNTLSKILRGKRTDTDGEYGTTTSRPRRVGYLDLPELRKAIWVDGVDELFISKMDHGSRFGNSIQIAENYNFNNKEIDSAPSSARSLQDCRPVYKKLSGWGDISNIRKYSDLPTETKNFVTYLEDQLGVPVAMLGLGPQRDQVIIR